MPFCTKNFSRLPFQTTHTHTLSTNYIIPTKREKIAYHCNFSLILSPSSSKKISLAPNQYTPLGPPPAELMARGEKVFYTTLLSFDSAPSHTCRTHTPRFSRAAINITFLSRAHPPPRTRGEFYMRAAPSSRARERVYLINKIAPL